MTSLPVRKYGGNMLISRDTAVAFLLIEPTPEEQAKLDASRAEYDRRRQAATAAWPGFVAALAAVTDPVGRAVLDMHRNNQGWCAGCEGWDNSGESPAWPCDTVDTVAKAVGIPIPEDLWLAEQATV